MNEKIVVIKPKTIDDVLINPGIGFTTFQRFNGDDLVEGKRWTEGAPIEYQKFKGTLENKNHPQTSIAYFRLYWKYIEPVKGEYRWDLIDKALETAKSRNQTLMLRVPPHGPYIEDDVPAWYREMVGSKTDWAEAKWLVDPEDPGYLECYGKLIKELGARYDGNPDLESIDASLVSAWGEGEGSEKLPKELIYALTDLYLDNFKNTPILMLIYNNGSSQYALSKANVGWRADCLGDMRGTGTQAKNDFKEYEVGEWCHMLDFYPREIIETGVSNAWKKAPVSFEVCWVVSHWFDMGWDIDYIIDQSLKWHISTFNAKSSPIPEEVMPKMDRWLKKMGYRLALRRFTYPETVQIGGKLDYTCWIENTGVAPCYKPFKFALRLKGENISRIFTTDANIIDWLPGDSLYDNSFVVPKDLPEGDYEIHAGIVDAKSLEPKVKFAMEGIRNCGWYTMGKIKLSK